MARAGRRMGLIAAMPMALLGSCASPLRDADLGPYPSDAPVVAVLDVQVNRRESWISLTNTSAVGFGPSTMWINGAYGRSIRSFGPGETLRLQLADFRREDGKRFRAGGFFATQLPSDVVLAELETDEGRYGLIVVDGSAD